MTSFDRSYRRTTCRFCGHDRLIEVLDLGDQPGADAFLPADRVADETRHPLRVNLCPRCGASQLSHVVAASSIYADYAYLSSTSRPLVDYYQSLVDHLVARFRPDSGAVVVDIGANDGIMLDRYAKDRFVKVGVEPSSAGEVAVAKGYDIRAGFFDEEAVTGILADPGPASLVTATNVFAHVDEIGAFARALERLLAPQGVAVLEFPYVVDTVDGLYFDTIYHEHLSYLGLTPVDPLMERSGLRVFDAVRTPFGASGPAIRVFVAKAASAHARTPAVGDLLAAEERFGIRDEAVYRRFAERVEGVGHCLLALIRDLWAEGGVVGAYTAPAKGNTLLNYLGLTPAEVVAVSERNERKIGLVTPGAHIPVVDDDTFLGMGITHALLLSWNYAEFFRANSPFAKAGGRFVVPLPEPGILPP